MEWILAFDDCEILGHAQKPIAGGLEAANFLAAGGDQFVKHGLAAFHFERLIAVVGDQDGPLLIEDRGKQQTVERATKGHEILLEMGGGPLVGRAYRPTIREG
jgi:hypothetical protein